MRKILFLLFLSLGIRTTAQIDTVSNISDTEKLYGLSLFWKEAAYNFAYFDKANINWDSAYQAYIPKILATKNTWDYYRKMQQFCALLKDGHTNVNVPGFKLVKGVMYRPLSFSWLDEKVIVTNVPKADSLTIPLGSEVMKVNDMPVIAYLEKEIIPGISASATHQLWNDAVRSLFNDADTNTVFRFTLKTPAGKIIYHTTHQRNRRINWAYPLPNTPWKRFRYEKLPQGIAYLQLNTFDTDSVVYDFKQRLPELYEAKAVIIDLRNNGGGNTGTGIEILKYFTSQKNINGSTWRTRQHIAAFKAWGSFIKDEELEKRLKQNPFNKAWTQKSYDISRGKYWYSGDTSSFYNDVAGNKLTVPLVVLIGNSTASAAEDFLIALDDLKGRAVTIGERTYGSTGQPLFFYLPGGGSARICTKRDTYPDGREFVGYGVKPDIEVKRTAEDYIKKKDAQLEKAIELLSSKMK
ncbi:peptidase S41 [Pseudoflavitalea sp. X16]|uniref:S41 family peptidase n=1 Tax=Paraflavitalea devenefica TaxID=2716334 RepID=UPI001421A253|nr:S41 family peptidase [Paraflavitalea devenefica]NII24610.1 peptidase S41 [Paraflavitalea devenefica]